MFHNIYTKEQFSTFSSSMSMDEAVLEPGPARAHGCLGASARGVWSGSGAAAAAALLAVQSFSLAVTSPVRVAPCLAFSEVAVAVFPASGSVIWACRTSSSTRLPSVYKNGLVEILFLSHSSPIVLVQPGGVSGSVTSPHSLTVCFLPIQCYFSL